MIYRSFFLSGFLVLASGLSISKLSSAQTLGIAQNLDFLTPSTGGKFLHWHGDSDRTYFLQIAEPSDPLKSWFWAPFIEAGNDEDITFEIDGTAEKGFFRLHYTDQLPGTGETLDTADYDNDGLTNLQEITHRPRPGGIAGFPGLSPNIQTNPLLADTDGDGLTDKWEEDHGLDPTDNGTRDTNNGPNADPDRDGLTNLQEQSAGSNPHAIDTDGDGISDSSEVEQGKNPNDASEAPAADWFVLVGDKPEGEEKIQIREFTIKKGTARLVVVGTESKEFPEWTEPSSEYDDVLDWTVVASVGTYYISGNVHVNDRHIDWLAAQINSTTLHGIGPAHIEGAKIFQAPPSADITVSVVLRATNVSDGILPSSVIVGLLPLDFIDKTSTRLTELKVGKMYPSVVTGTGLPGSVVSLNLDADQDRFRVRVRDGAALSSVKMKFGTVDNPDPAYNDDPTEYTLETLGGDAITKNMLLVADSIDDDHEKSYSSPKKDDEPDDITHKIQLGGNFKISEVQAGYGTWSPADLKLPVNKKKTVKVQFVNCTYGIFSTNPCWSSAQIEWAKLKMQERYAQVGIEFDFPAVLAGSDIGNSGILSDSEIPTFSPAAGKISFPQKTKDIVDSVSPNDFYNTLMIYLVKGMGLSVTHHHGVATPPKYVDSADIRFQNKILLANNYLYDFTAAHEALHILTDSAHSAPPYNDFSTEYADDNTIWTVPPDNEFAARRSNQSIGSTKRISTGQESKAQSSPLAK